MYTENMHVCVIVLIAIDLPGGSLTAKSCSVSANSMTDVTSVRLASIDGEEERRDKALHEHSMGVRQTAYR